MISIGTGIEPLEKPKIGELDPKLWIALEDIHDSWEKSGSVGQEVYGAGNAFGILPRHYNMVPGAEFMIFADYPLSGFSAKKKGRISFRVIGDERLSCRLMVVRSDDKKLPDVNVILKGRKESLPGALRRDGHLEFQVGGNTTVTIHWGKQRR